MIRRALPWSFETVFRIKDNILVRAKEDKMVIVMNVEQPQIFYEIDAQAAKVILKIDGRRSVDRIISMLYRGKNSPSLNREIKKFMLQLLENEIIE